MKTFLVILIVFIASLSFSQEIVQMGQYETLVLCADSVYLAARDSILMSTIVIGEFQESLISEDHTSEGFILGLENGDLINIFRLDPGFEGDHVGNNAMLVKRISSDNGQTWTPPEPIYNDFISDNRNMQGALIGKDSIVVFFRRYWANPPAHQLGMYYFYSFDGGITWTEPNMISTILSNSAFTTSKLTYVPNRGYLLPIYNAHYYVEIRFSPDGLSWDNIDYVWDYRMTFQYKISEPSFAYVGNGQIIGIFRNDLVGLGQNYFKVYSSDYGYTWTEPQSTNLAYPFTCPAPLIFYDEDYDDVWTIVTDRRSNIPGQNPYEESIWIYKNKAHEIALNPQNFNLIAQIQRPQPTNFRFYGYPAQMKISPTTYLIIITESFKKLNNKEGANLFQFEISYDSAYLPISLYAWCNGSESQTIVINESGFYSVIMADSFGNYYTDSLFIYVDKHPVQVFLGDTINAIYGMTMLSAGNPGKQYLWSTGETSQKIIVFEEGIYFVTITNSCGQEIVDNVYVYFGATEGVEEITLNEPSVYPNPMTDKFLIDYHNYDEVIINIFDLNGKLVLTQDYYNEEIYVDHLPPATYIIEIITGDEVFRERIVKY